MPLNWKHLDEGTSLLSKKKYHGNERKKKEQAMHLPRASGIWLLVVAEHDDRTPVEWMAAWCGVESEGEGDQTESSA